MGLDINDVFHAASDALSDFFEQGGNILKEPMKRLCGDKELLGELASLVVKALQKIIEVTTDPAQKAAKDVSGVLQKFTKEVLKALNTVLTQFNDLPEPFRGGAKQLFDTLADLSNLFDGTRLQQIIDRLDAAQNSLVQLFAIIGGAEDGATLPIPFPNVTPAIKELLKTPPDRDRAQKAVVELVFNLLFPVEMIGKLLESAGKGNLWSWVKIVPPTAKPGDLNRWLNKEDYFKFLSETGEPVRLLDLQRAFRVMLISRLDMVARGNMDPNQIPDFGGGKEIWTSQTNALLAGVVSALINTTVQFVFESECYPIEVPDLESIEQIGFHFSMAISSQIKILVRSLTGILLRGIWIYTIRNELLIELISIVVSTAISAAVEALLRNITASVHITSRYQNDPFGGPDGIHKWRSLEAVTGTGQYLEYVVLAKVGVNNVQLSSGPLCGFLEDFGAYLDAAYRDFRFDTRFPDLDADQIVVSVADLDRQSKTLTVVASTSEYDSVPRPVLRVYYCCTVAVMTPGPEPSDGYRLSLTVPDISGQCGELLVLSNRGGRKRRRVVIR